MSPRNDVRLSLSVSLSLPHTHSHSHRPSAKRVCVSTTLRDYVNEMKYSGGLVSERNQGDCGADTKDEGEEKERGGVRQRDGVQLQRLCRQ